jgi:hypothetical protein
MCTSRKTFTRSVSDKMAEGERGTCTFVLTDRGFITFERRQRWTVCEGSAAHRKLVELAKDLDIRIRARRRRREPGASRSAIRHCARKDVLAKLLDLVAHHALHRAAGRQGGLVIVDAELCENNFIGCGLDFDS